MMIINKEKIDKVKGFLDDREANYLYKLALKAGKNGPCLEIGSYCGKSSVYLGAACKENSTVLFSIDHHGGSEEQQPGELLPLLLRHSPGHDADLGVW